MNNQTHTTVGSVAAGFEPVREVFDENFVTGGEVGASLCVIRKGERVVDLWGGHRDAARTHLWTPDTLVNVYSTTKGPAALAFATLVDDGLLDYETPVADVWPELKAGRNGLSVGALLAHQGGLCGVDTPVSVEDLYDWHKMCSLLAAQEPYWEPGTAAGYHAVVWGYLPGELARRVTGKTLGELLRQRIAGPVGADFHLGLPASEDHRVAPMIGPNRSSIAPAAGAAEVKMPALHPVALQNPVIRPYKDASSPAWRRAEIAAANGQASARGVAQIYGAVVGRGQPELLKPATLDALTKQRVGLETDLVLGRPVRRGAGIILNTEAQYGPCPRAFGHAGAGGSVGFADPDAGISFGYVMNQMMYNLDDDSRSGRLIRALYGCLEAGG